ncbi:class II aldolase/adducin family protein [Streptomyces sp. NPDC087856]|uniref:class II aldolase/adducin family protein n=1 Tax=Streptomyces sp. NPDC087856 TaxID=3365811 RepID=UPI0038206421
MSELFARVTTDLVVANRILAEQDVVDAYGHVSARHPHDPNRFLQSRSRSPQFVEADDIMEFDLDGQCVDPADDRPPYLERFIHAAIYRARPDVHSVVHAHTEALLPYSISDTELVPVIHSASEMGPHVPKWDIRDRFGDATDLLVTSPKMGHDLAECLGSNSVALMRGHGFVAAHESLITLIGLCVYLAKNARVLTTARLLGSPITPLTPGEAGGRRSEPGANFDPDSPGVRRSWDYWAARAGCSPDGPRRADRPESVRPTATEGS